MNFLLVTGKDALAGEAYVFPLGIAYVSSALKKAGINVICLNTNHTDDDLFSLLSDIIKYNNINVVMTGGMSVMFSQINNIVTNAKKINPQIITVVGGPIATCDPELALRNMEIDYCVLEEGEITAVNLAKALMDGLDIASVDGIAFLDSENKFVKTTARSAIEPLDDLLFPDYDGFEFSVYLKTINLNSNTLFKSIGNIIPASIITSRSCPFSCTFCYHPLGKKYRQRGLDNVFDEIELLISKYNVNFIDVMDDLFSINKARMYEFADRIKKYNIKWQCQLRVNDVSKELLHTLKDSGLVVISYGIESVNDTILKSMKKKTTKANIEKALKLTRQAKIMIVGNLLFGDTEDDESTVQSYIEWKINNRQYPLNLVAIKVVPDAPIYQIAINSGKITDKFDFMKKKFPFINITKMSDDAYQKWLSHALNFNQYDKRMFLVGKVLRSAALGNDNYGRRIFEVSSICPECKKISSYGDLIQNEYEKYSEFVCQHCFQRYKLSTAGIFQQNYSFIAGLKFNFVHFVLFHYNKNYWFKKLLKQNELCYGIFVKFVNNFKYLPKKV